MFTSAACVYLALVRSTGPLLPALLCGILFLATVMVLLGIENLIVGGILGTILAAVILLCIWPRTSEATTKCHLERAVLIQPDILPLIVTECHDRCG